MTLFTQTLTDEELDNEIDELCWLEGLTNRSRTTPRSSKASRTSSPVREESGAENGIERCPLTGELAPIPVARRMQVVDVPAAPPKVARVVRQWEYRERIARAGQSPEWHDGANAARLGRTVGRIGFTPSDDWLQAGELAYARGRLGSGEPNDLDALTRTVKRAALAAASGGFDALDVAMSAAELDADHFVDSVPQHRQRAGRDRLAKLAALAAHLAELAKRCCRQWFAFGSERIAAWLGCCRETVDTDIQRLEQAGLFDVRRDENGQPAYCYLAGESREVMYHGRDLPPSALGDPAPLPAQIRQSPASVVQPGQYECSTSTYTPTRAVGIGTVEGRRGQHEPATNQPADAATRHTLNIRLGGKGTVFVRRGAITSP